MYRAAKFIENFRRKESDLTFVVVLEIEVTITAYPAPRQAFDLRKFDHGMRIRLATVVADKIVSTRDVKVADFHCCHDNIEAARFT